MRRGARILLALALTCRVASAREARIAPAADGAFGAWLVAGPITEGNGGRFDAANVAPRSGGRVLDQPWAPSWRVLDARDGALDLAKALGTTSQAGPVALLAATIRVEHAVDTWLLLSADGGAQVFVDGKRVFDRDIVRLRDISWDAVPIALPAGAHRLVLRLHHRGDYWAVATRIVDRRDLLAPAGLAIELPGTDDADTARLARDLLDVRVESGLDSGGYRPRVLLDYPRGAPLDVPLGASLGLAIPGASATRAAIGAVPVGPRGAHPLEATLAPLIVEPRPTRATVRVRVGTVEVTRTLPLDGRAPLLLDRAASAARSIAGTQLLDPAAVTSTIELYAERLKSAGEDGSHAVSELDALLSRIEHGGDPLVAPGVFDIGLRSEIDGRPQPVRVHVPAGYAPGSSQTYPLVVALHGLNGDPTGVMNAFLDSKDTGPRSGVDGFVVAPYAHGNAFYRGPGEHEVMHALEWAMRTYPIDPLRVSITGVSMGGTGTAGLALLHTDRFAAASPLCGYQSFFIRRDTSNRPIRPWETDLMAHWSPASWAENGRNLPLYLAQGTKDYPLENGKVLVKRYRDLGYRITEDWPDIGHHVWEITWKGAKMWPWLTRFRRDPSPKHVTLVADQLRYAHQAWLSISALALPGRMGHADATRATATRIAVTTESVDGVSVDRKTSGLADGAAVELDVDGTVVAFAAGTPLEAHRADGTWHAGAPALPPHAKRAGLEGPIHDAFLGPVTFVYGSLDPATMRANRDVAEAFARRQPGMDARYPVVADRDLDPATPGSLFVVGTARDNVVLRAIDADLPVHTSIQGVTLGPHAYAGNEVGAIFVYPDPRTRDRYVIVVQGTTVQAIWRSLSLPRLLPDFVVFDGRLAGAAGQQVLGATASVLAAGFFNADWGVPADVADPDAPSGAP